MPTGGGSGGGDGKVHGVVGPGRPGLMKPANRRAGSGYNPRTREQEKALEEIVIKHGDASSQVFSLSGGRQMYVDAEDGSQHVVDEAGNIKRRG